MPSLNTGNAILSNPIKVDSSYNVGIGGAASGSFKLQVTGTTNLTGALSGTSAAFSGNLTIGNPSSALAQFHIYNSSAAASMLVQTNSAADYSEIAARNFNQTSTCYYRQYSSSASGTDFGASRANLAALFSNYASNLAIGTQNGGDLILGTANTERLRVLASNGNVGIGTSSPTELLDVNGAIKINNYITTRTSGYTSYNLNAYYDVSTWRKGASGYARRIQMGSDNGGSLQYSVSSAGGSAGDSITWSDKLVIKDDGNVGIGTNSPSAGLEVVTDSGAFNALRLVSNRAQSSGTDVAIAFRYLYDTTNYATGGLIVAGKDNTTSGSQSGNLQFYTNNAGTVAERMRITSGGNVLIGKTSDSGLAALQVNNDISAGNSLNSPTAYKINSDNNWAFGSFNSGSQYWMQVQFSGVGDDTRGFRVFNTTSGGIVEFRVNGAGSAFLRGSLTQNASDERLKTNIKNIDNALQKVLSINGVTFDWNDTAINAGFLPSIRYNDAGVIAQEIQEVLPQAVDFAPFDYQDGVSKSGEHYLTVKYEKIVPLLIEAIKEQQAQINELKALIAAK